MVLFLKQEGALKNMYQFSIIKEIRNSKDEKVRKVIVTYRNYNESVSRETQHGVRHIVMINPVDEVNVTTELEEITIAAAIFFKICRNFDFL